MNDLIPLRLQSGAGFCSSTDPENRVWIWLFFSVDPALDIKRVLKDDKTKDQQEEEEVKSTKRRIHKPFSSLAQ